MKLLLCPECADVQKLSREPRRCQCGASGGRYVDDLNAEYDGAAIPLGIHNADLARAVCEEPRADGLGWCFVAWVIPWSAPTVRRAEEEAQDDGP